MAAALLPSLGSAAASLVTSATPAAMAKLKKLSPGSYEQLARLTGLSGTTPEALAQKASSQGNTMVTQSLIASAAKAGFSIEQIGQALPALTAADLQQLRAQVMDVEVLMRNASEKERVDVKGDPTIVLGQLVSSTERVCKVMGLTSDQLADVLAYVNTHAPSDVANYQRFVRASGRRPV